MRKWNAFISAGIIVLLLIHGIAGSYQLLGLLPGGNTTLEVLAWAMAGLIALHMILGIKLTYDTLAACRRSGAPYFRRNLGFWTKRISGFAIILFVILHLLVFADTGSGLFRLHLFAGKELAASILLVISLLVHVLTNLKPLAISFGAGGFYRFLRDALFVLAVVLLACAAAFVFYYLRWNVLWR